MRTTILALGLLLTACPEYGGRDPDRCRPDMSFVSDCLMQCVKGPSPRACSEVCRQTAFENGFTFCDEGKK